MQILVLDSDRSLSALIVSACKKLGFRARVCRDREQIVEEHVKEPCALIIGLNQPEEDAFAALDWLHTQSVSLPTAFCAGSAEFKLVRKAEQEAPVLPKVWTHTDLRKILRTLSRQLRKTNPGKTAPKVRTGWGSTKLGLKGSKVTPARGFAVGSKTQNPSSVVGKSSAGDEPATNPSVDHELETAASKDPFDENSQHPVGEELEIEIVDQRATTESD